MKTCELHHLTQGSDWNRSRALMRVFHEAFAKSHLWPFANMLLKRGISKNSQIAGHRDETGEPTIFVV
ncbi:hypothetical protein [uncultured Desulfuromonas sp.]|uniref:hypothetical protein n=1 Tax=uncultured Desulfuromonas sp. TaxID=181013 RepID=UPI002AAB7712|nr:hypothetical protein [uncultured Desulfuromonas sp.]